MSNSIVSNAKNMHYTVSTFAAVVYALVWILSSRADAETQVASISQNSVPEVVVTAHRDTVQTEYPEVVVWASREPAATQVAMEEVVVWGHREPASDEVRVAAVATSSRPGANSKAGGGWFAKARSWLHAALM